MLKGKKIVKKIISSVMLFSLLFGCDEADFLNYKNPPKQERTDKTVDISSFIAPGVDILFVVDNSGSMGGIQQNIVKNSEIFMKEFIKGNLIDWRLGVVSTDKAQAPFLGFETIFDKNITNPVPIFKNAIDSLGTSGSGWEFIFYNGLRHLTDPNYNFVRRHSHLAIVMVTDEEEQSEDEYGAQYEALTFINAVKSLKDPTKKVRFYGAFDFDDLEECDNWGASYYGSPFEKVITETGGIFMSACTEDFGVKLAEIGRDIASLVDLPTITLNTRPKIETIQVFYKGVELPAGDRDKGGVWFYDKYYNTITFYTLDFVADDSDFNVNIKFDIQDGINRD